LPEVVAIAGCRALIASSAGDLTEREFVFGRKRCLAAIDQIIGDHRRERMIEMRDTEDVA